MANIIKNGQELVRNIQETCDELERKEIEKSILQRQKEDAEYVAEITTKANEELVKEIRDLNYKSHLYGVSHTEPKQEVYNCQCQHHEHTCQCQQHHEHVCNCQHHEHECQCYKHEERQEVITRDVNVRFPWFKERKSMFLATIGIVIILLLATGFTPSGDFWTAVQDQWITLIADVFRIALVVICCVLIYFGLIKNKR